MVETTFRSGSSASLASLPTLSPLPKRNWWVVTKDWVSHGHTVPKGFVTDLDSIPYVPIVHEVFKGRSRTAALLHDYLYATCAVERKVADKLFYNLMLEEKIKPVFAYMMYLAVRALGWNFYRRSLKREPASRVYHRIANNNGEAPVLSTRK